MSRDLPRRCCERAVHVAVVLRSNQRNSLPVPIFLASPDWQPLRVRLKRVAYKIIRIYLKLNEESEKCSTYPDRHSCWRDQRVTSCDFRPGQIACALINVNYVRSLHFVWGFGATLKGHPPNGSL
jgi:hypothetical protein